MTSANTLVPTVKFEGNTRSNRKHFNIILIFVDKVYQASVKQAIQSDVHIYVICMFTFYCHFMMLKL